VKLKLQHLIETLRSTYWFIPTIMAVIAGVGAVLLVQVDRFLSARFVDQMGWIYSGGPEGARAMLSVVAGSVMGTAGVTFSITIAALSLASTQLGPRILYNFMRDTGNQFVLGTFIATFVFCVLILRTIRGADEAGRFVPAISITVGLALGLLSMGVLIYFIHHVAVSIQAPNVVAVIGRDLADEVEREFAPENGIPPEKRTPGLPDEFDRDAAVVESTVDGYVQALDEDALVEIAQRADLLLVIERRPGKFVSEGLPLVRAWPAERMNLGWESDIRSRFVLGWQRTSEQDVEFAADQLSEVAIRALSPAINDPFTAMGCLDWLGAALCRAARGRTPDPVRVDDEGRVRVVYRHPITFSGLADAAFVQIRQFGARSPAVMLRMLEVITTVIRSTRGDRDEIQVLLQHAETIRRAALDNVEEPRDRNDIEERYQTLLRAAELMLGEAARA
jgi:uncharacterized membrane protein